jgi:hypothetical protein
VIDEGQEVLDAPAGQLIEGNVGPLAGHVGFGVEAGDAQGVQVRGQVPGTVIGCGPSRRTS